MDVAVKLFGAVREAVGAKELSVRVPEGCSVADLRDQLAREHPIFDEFGNRLAVSVNLEITSLDAVLREAYGSSIVDSLEEDANKVLSRNN